LQAFAQHHADWIMRSRQLRWIAAIALNLIVWTVICAWGLYTLGLVWLGIDASRSFFSGPDASVRLWSLVPILLPPLILGVTVVVVTRWIFGARVLSKWLWLPFIVLALIWAGLGVFYTSVYRP